MNSQVLRAIDRKLKNMANQLGDQSPMNDNLRGDDFERARLMFEMSLKAYEQLKESKNINTDKLQQIRIDNDMREHLKTMQQQLKYMIKHIQIKNKELKKKQAKFGQENERKKKELQDEVDYKKLVCLNNEKAYGLILGTRDEEQAPKVTLEQLINKSKRDTQQPLRMSYQEDDDFDQQMILNALKQIDDLIQSRLDDIIAGIDKLQRQAISISEALDLTHQQIVLNLQHLQKNEEQLNNANKKLKKYITEQKRVSFWVKLIVIVLFGVILYLLYKQFSPQVSKSGV